MAQHATQPESALGSFTDNLESMELAEQQFTEHGYVVVPGLLPDELTQSVKKEFIASVKTFTGPLLRQADAQPSAHRLSPEGYMLNSLLHVHRLTEERFAGFRRAVLAVVGQARLQQLLSRLVGEEPVLVQTMYFESSQGNFTHADSHFIDSGAKGRMVGCWIALEDIGPEAGRFTLYPGTHRLFSADQGTGEVAAAAAEYEAHSLEVITGYQEHGSSLPLAAMARSRKLLKRLLALGDVVPVTPSLSAGDVVVFSSLTLHESARPSAKGGTRHSLTAHFVPRSKGLRLSGQAAEELEVGREGELLIQQ